MTINELLQILESYTETDRNKEVKVEVREDRFVFLEDVKTVQMDEDGEYLEITTE